MRSHVDAIEEVPVLMEFRMSNLISSQLSKQIRENWESVKRREM